MFKKVITPDDLTPELNQLKGVCDSLGISYTESDTVESLTAAIASEELDFSALDSCTVEQLKVIADVLEMTYSYVDKEGLIIDILEAKEA